jgi:hypothetical protein
MVRKPRSEYRENGFGEASSIFAIRSAREMDPTVTSCTYELLEEACSASDLQFCWLPLLLVYPSGTLDHPLSWENLNGRLRQFLRETEILLTRIQNAILHDVYRSGEH